MTDNEILKRLTASQPGYKKIGGIFALNSAISITTIYGCWIKLNALNTDVPSIQGLLLWGDIAEVRQLEPNVLKITNRSETPLLVGNNIGSLKAMLKLEKDASVIMVVCDRANELKAHLGKGSLLTLDFTKGSGYVYLHRNLILDMADHSSVKLCKSRDAAYYRYNRLSCSRVPLYINVRADAKLRLDVGGKAVHTKRSIVVKEGEVNASIKE